MKTMLLVLLSAAAVSCTSSVPASAPAARGKTGAVPQAAQGNAQVDVMALGRRIWQNECAGKQEGLVSWNAGEEFPSLGIGHFIWYPKGYRGPFEESWPSFVRFAQAKGARVPSELQGTPPWSSRSAFMADARNPRVNAMRVWLSQPGIVRLQTEFIMARSRQALPAMLAASSQPREVEARYHALSRTTGGMYALVDYVNFKGEGTNPDERYNGQGWGLLQVLENMRGLPQGSEACREFSRAAAGVLARRVANSPKGRGEQRWLQGWTNRCKTYAGE